MRISDWSSDVCSSDLATDLGGEIACALLQHRVVEHLARFHRKRRRGKQQHRQHKEQRPHNPSAASSGFTSRSMISGTSGPRWCQRMRPLPSMMKVSGTPVTPHSTARSEEHTYELQALMRIPYAVICLKKKK